MDVKLLKELLNLDKTVQKSDKMQVPKKIEISKIQETDDISSNLMKTIIDAHEPVDVDLQSISDYDSSTSSSYDSFYDLN
jgi:hypothetical protein